MKIEHLLMIIMAQLAVITIFLGGIWGSIVHCILH
jgi:hypothetical protein